MKASHVWLGAALLLLVAAGIYWIVSGPRETPVEFRGLPATAVTEDPPAEGISRAVRSSNSAARNPQQASILRKPIHVVASDGTAAVPSRYQIAGVKRVQTGRNFDDWMSYFSEQDQKVLRGFDKRFYGVYQGRNANQIAWMAAHGYPMPEDILAAEFIDTAALRKMAASGNIKAGFLLKDRELREIAKRMREQDKYYGQVLGSDPDLERDDLMLDTMITGSASPYRAFMHAQGGAVLGTSDPESIDGRVIGSLYWAVLLGDRGAAAMIKSFVQSAPDGAARDHRRAVNSGASSLLNEFLTRRGARARAGLPIDDCMQLFGGNDFYPGEHSSD